MNNTQRFRILTRDAFRCVYCGATGATVPLEVDHVLPRSAGGRDVDDNLVTACRPCNQGKKARRLPPELFELFADPDTLPVLRFPGSNYMEHISHPLSRIYQTLDAHRRAA